MLSEENIHYLLYDTQAQIIGVLREINQFDLELWDHAKLLVRNRLGMHESFSFYLNHDKNGENTFAAKTFMKKFEFSCFKVPDSFNTPKPLPPYLSSQVGLFRPPLHKGPL